MGPLPLQWCFLLVSTLLACAGHVAIGAAAAAAAAPPPRPPPGPALQLLLNSTSLAVHGHGEIAAALLLQLALQHQTCAARDPVLTSCGAQQQQGSGAPNRIARYSPAVSWLPSYSVLTAGSAPTAQHRSARGCTGCCLQAPARRSPVLMGLSWAIIHRRELAWQVLAIPAAKTDDTARRQAQETLQGLQAPARQICQEIRLAGDCVRYSHLCPSVCASGAGAAQNATVKNATAGSAPPPSPPSGSVQTYAPSCAVLLELEGGCAHDLSISDPTGVPAGTRVGEICWEECAGHGSCAAATADFGFLDEIEDSSGNDVVVELSGDACVDGSGLQLSGRNRAELDIGNHYAEDGTFSITLWVLKDAAIIWDVSVSHESRREVVYSHAGELPGLASAARGDSFVIYLTRGSWLGDYIVNIALRSGSMQKVFQFQASLHRDEVPEWTHFAFSVGRNMVRFFQNGAPVQNTEEYIPCAEWPSHADGAGWSNADLGVYSLGALHGPFDNSVNRVRKDVDVSLPDGVDTASCTVSWRSFIFGSFDGNDHQSVIVDGNEVWQAPTSNIYGVANNGDASLQNGWLGVCGPPSLHPLAGLCEEIGLYQTGTFPWAIYQDVAVTVPCSNTTMSLHFRGVVDSGISDEGWGFSDVKVLYEYGSTLRLVESDCEMQAAERFEWRGTGLLQTAVLGNDQLSTQNGLAGSVSMVQVYSVALELSDIECIYESGRRLVQTGRLALSTTSIDCQRGPFVTGCTSEAATNGPLFGQAGDAAAPVMDDGSCEFDLGGNTAVDQGFVPVTEHWQRIQLRGSYSRPIVICGPLTRSSTTQAVVRVGPVQMDAGGEWSFAVRAEQKKCHIKIADPPPLAEQVSFLVVEAGDDPLGGWQAGAVRVVDKEWHRASFHRPIRDPVVLTTVQNFEERTPLVSVRQYLTGTELRSSFFFAAEGKGVWCVRLHSSVVAWYTENVLIPHCHMAVHRVYAGALMASSLLCVACMCIVIRAIKFVFDISGVLCDVLSLCRSTTTTCSCQAAQSRLSASATHQPGESLNLFPCT